MCPECFDSDVKTVGESFWHRSHQLYGVDVCYKHGCILIETDINIGTGLKSIRYILPEERFIKCTVKTEGSKHFIELARSVHYLLNSNDTNTNIKHVTDGYHFNLKTQDCTSRMGGNFVPKLQQDLIEFYRYINIDTSAMQQRRYGRFTWVENLLEGVSDRLHPLDHLLFIYFLGLSCEQFMSQVAIADNILEQQVIPHGKNTSHRRQANGVSVVLQQKTVDEDRLAK